MANTSPHSGDSRQIAAAIQLPSRLWCCWECDLDWESFLHIWNKYDKISYSCIIYVFGYKCLICLVLKQACYQMAKSISMLPTAVLAGLVFITSYSMSHSVVEVEGTDLCKYLRKLVRETWLQCGQEEAPFWMLDDWSFEKLGELMQENHWKLLGLYDELPMFLS